MQYILKFKHLCVKSEILKVGLNFSYGDFLREGLKFLYRYVLSYAYQMYNQRVCKKKFALNLWVGI